MNVKADCITNLAKLELWMRKVFLEEDQVGVQLICHRTLNMTVCVWYAINHFCFTTIHDPKLQRED